MSCEVRFFIFTIKQDILMKNNVLKKSLATVLALIGTGLSTAVGDIKF